MKHVLLLQCRNVFGNGEDARWGDMPSGVGRHPFHSDESIVALRAHQLTIFASNYPTCVQVFYDLDQLSSRYEEINTHEPEEEITIIENPFPISEDAFCGFLHAARAQWVDLTVSVRSCPQFSKMRTSYSPTGRTGIRQAAGSLPQARAELVKLSVRG